MEKKMATESVIKKIEKLLSLANNNTNEAEAQAAMLKATELMHEYDVHVSKSEDKPTYASIPCVTKSNKSFRGPLATIIAKNTRCDVITVGGASGVIHFVGHKQDAEAAKLIFEYCYTFVRRTGKQMTRQSRKESGTAVGLFNSYALGFLNGLKARFDEQCTALMIVTPQDVHDKFNELYPSRRQSKSKLQSNKFDREAFSKGVEDGKHALGKRELNR